MRWLIFFISLFSVEVRAFDPKEITYENLSTSYYTDHVGAFRSLFSLMKVHSFLEFGVGMGTKYFLDHCDTVTSLEISIASRADAIDPWYRDCLAAYREYKNWTPLFCRATGSIDFYNLPPALDYWIQNKRYLPAYLKDYEEEVSLICTDILKNKKYDVAFVDSGLFTIAHFVMALLGNVDIVVAHDTQNSIYGWSLIPIHPDYEMIEYTSCNDQGTTFWIKKEKEELIKELRFLFR